MKKFVFLVAMFVPAFAFCQNEEYYRPNLSQSVIKSSAPVFSVDVSSSASTQVDSPKLTGSWMVDVQNLDTSPVCCALDVITSTTTATGGSCQEIAAKGTVGDSRTFFRWWQNLSVYCRTTKSGATSNVRALQGR